MAYKLYNRLGSGGFVVEAALNLVDAPFEFIEIDSIPNTPLPDSFREINPWGQVPVLITPEGMMMSESAAMLIEIAARYPGTDAGPHPATADHAAFLRWLVFMSVNVYENVLREGYPSRYTSDLAGIDGVVEAGRRRQSEALNLLDEQVGRHGQVLPGGFSSADIYLAMLNAWHGEGRGLPACDALTHKVAAHPIIAPIWQQNFDHRLSTKWGR